MNSYHNPVLLKETLDILQVKKGHKYIDATLGGAGHTKEILRLGGIVLGIDVDRDALSNTKNLNNLDKLTLAKGNFRNIREIAHSKGFTQVDGILFDLGVSSHQLDTTERGFSFQNDAPLDMRMDETLSVTAKDLVNALSRNELIELFTKYAEEPFAKSISTKIVEARKKKPIETTLELVSIIKSSIKGPRDKINPATRIFQALRIAINDELHSLEEALPEAVELLNKGGRLCVISFHSLEDRIVKNTFKEFESKKIGKILIDKPINPSEEEERENKRSRSAKLRAFEKTI